MILEKGHIAYMMVTGNTIMTSIAITYGLEFATWLQFDVYNHVYNNILKKN